MIRKRLILKLILIVLLTTIEGSPQGETVGRWAEKLGKELWDLGQIITKSSEIKFGYPFLNAKVETKDPKQLIEEIIENISRMMDRKMDAIKCILKTAESAAEEFELNETDRFYQYYSSKYSPIYDEKLIELPESLEDNKEMYLPMGMNNDTHFYNLRVNTTLSSVHVPINVFDRHDEAEVAIRWSEVLDDIFIANYKSDPALSWQYFGSSSGIMRHYPAMRWNNIGDDLFDCRIRTWFIEAATCTKDVVLLLDNSGSMTGMRKHIASLTVHSILDTLSNNDFINIMNYSESVNFTVPCFQDVLVQATEENIVVFKNAVNMLDPVGKSYINVALPHAFKLLADYREMRGCSEDSRDCNQALMLITDGIAGNLTSLIQEYNWMNNGSSIPVRIFTFLVGNEVSNAVEVSKIACNNRGYHSHVQSLEQVTESVYKYVPVLSRPLILKGDHPISWTHAYYDSTFDRGVRGPFDKYRLLTSVAVPAFDTKSNKNNDTRTANLLGVAATDIPIQDIERLMYPYKIGVNSHSFIVSNLGYVLLHPDLRPMFNNKLKDNYNSIDLTEVEQFDNDKGPRELDDVIVQLRNALVKGEEGVLHDIKIKYHYDDMRRVSREVNDYYFAPIVNTPFSIAFAIPDLYGNYSIEVEEEYIHMGKEITQYFQGNNWKVHPKWSYCKYHYLEGHEFTSPEKELLHFLGRMYEEDFKWAKQYESEISTLSNDINDNTLQDVECGRKTLGDDDYYCDKKLVQRLVFDAKNTLPAFAEKWRFRNDLEEYLFLRYYARLRFVATMSGLTRWEYIFGDDEENNITEFGDLHSRTIDEIWYKAAVIQYKYDRESFVYAVPFDDESEDMLVTGSYPIFPSHGGVEAPGSVVGYQFSHAHLTKRFFEIANTTTCRECLPCGPLLECYVIDHNGYIVISKNRKDAGRFFGEVEGAVMQAMLNEDIYEQVTVYDYQALCPYVYLISGEGNILLTPLKYLKLLLNWLIGKIVWAIVQTNLQQMWDPNWILVNAYEDNPTTPIPLKPTTRRLRKGQNQEEEDWFKQIQEPKYDTRYTACEKQRDLYVLRQEIFADKNLYSSEVPASCVRPFYVKKVHHSNLLLIAIKTSYPEQCPQHLTTAPIDIIYENSTDYPCKKLYLNNLSRRRLAGCVNEHELEHEIKTCGKSNRTEPTILTIIFIIYIRIWSV